MRRFGCPWEDSVLLSARSGRWEPSLSGHLAECEHCRELSQVAEWVRHLGQASARRESVPDPTVLWFKARLFADQAAKEKVVKPLVWIEAVAQGATAAVLSSWLLWKWPALKTALTDWWFVFLSFASSIGWPPLEP